MRACAVALGMPAKLMAWGCGCLAGGAHLRDHARAVHKGREELVQQLDLLVDGGVGEDGGEVVDGEDARLVLEDRQRQQPREGPRPPVLRRLAHREQVADDQPHHVEERERGERAERVGAVGEARRAELVVRLAPRLVLEHLVRVLEPDEALGRALVVRVLVGVVLERDLAVGVLDLGGGRVDAHAERLEVVGLAADHLE